MGRKARALARAGAAGLRTPGGCVLPADVFWAMLEAHGVAVQARYLAAAAFALDPAHVHAIANEIAAALDASSVEATAVGHAEALFGTLPAGPIVCRSSAAMEDGADAAFPGMFTSVLDIRSPKALGQAIARCWRSVFAPDLIRYLLRLRPAEVDFSLALLVQPQVAAAWYGLCFAADPLGASEGMVVELSDGAPDALVGGESARLRFTFRDGRWQGDGEPPSGLDRLPAAMTELIRLAGRPVDVEFALTADGALVVFQARPLTAQAPRTRHPEPAGVRARFLGQGCAGGWVSGTGGRDIALVDALTTRDYARVLDARAIVAAAETSPLGHVAILCRELGVPLVAGVGADLSRLHGESLLVDGDAGHVLLLMDLPSAEASPVTVDGESEAVFGIDKLAIRLLVAPDSSIEAILADRQRALGAVRMRVVGSAPSPELAAMLSPEIIERVTACAYKSAAGAAPKIRRV